MGTQHAPIDLVDNCPPLLQFQFFDLTGEETERAARWPLDQYQSHMGPSTTMYFGGRDPAPVLRPGALRCRGIS